MFFYDKSMVTKVEICKCTNEDNFNFLNESHDEKLYSFSNFEGLTQILMDMPTFSNSANPENI